MFFVLFKISASLSELFESTQYIDPNTGGMLFQMLAIIFTVFSGVLLFFSRQIRMVLSRFKRYLRSYLNLDQ
jgi:hypothetical protein